MKASHSQWNFTLWFAVTCIHGVIILFAFYTLFMSEIPENKEGIRTAFHRTSHSVADVQFKPLSLSISFD